MGSQGPPGPSGFVGDEVRYFLSTESTNLLLIEREGRIGNIGPRSWQYGPSEAKSVQKRPRANIPQCGSS